MRHDLCCRMYEPQLFYMHADAAADDAVASVACQIVPVLFLGVSNVVDISSRFSLVRTCLLRALVLSSTEPVV